MASGGNSATLTSEPTPMSVPSRSWSLSIGGVDQTARVEKRSIKGDWTRGGFANLSFNTFDTAIGAGAFRSALDAEVLFTYDGVLRYRGMISSVEDQPLGGIRSGTRQSVKCMDYSALLDRVIITGSAHDYSGTPQAILWSIPAALATDMVVPPGMIPIRLHQPHSWVTGDTVLISGHYSEPPDSSINAIHTITVPPNPTGDYWIASSFFIPGPDRTTSGGAGEARRVFTMKSLITDIVETFLTPNYGITLDMSMPDGPWLESLSVTGATVNEALRQLSASTGWLYRVLPTKVLEVFVPGTKLAPFNLDGASTAAPIQWQRARTRFTNRVRVVAGGTQKIVATETFVHTGGPASVYQAGYPASQDVNDTFPSQLIVNGEAVGTVGFGPLQLPAPAWYWDPATSQLVQQNGAQNFPAGAVLTVTYARQYPVVVTAEDPIDVQPPPVGRGPWETVIEAPEIFDRAQAQGLADNMIAQRFSQPRALQTSTYAGFATPGDRITLAYPDRVVASSPWLVESVSWVFVGRGILYFEYTFVEGQTSLRRDAEDEFAVTGNWITDFQELLAGGGGAGGVTGSTTGGGGLPTTPPPTGGGGGTEEVFVGPTDPGATLELWYDTDEPAPEATIPDHSIDLVKLQQIPTQTVLGRSTPAVGIIEILTVLPTAVQNSITRLGTIVSGVWNGTPIGLTYLAGAGAAGTFVRSTGTNWATSTLLLPNTAGFMRVVYATAPNTYGDSANLTFTGSALALVGNQTVTGFIGSATYASQTTGWRIDSAGGADFRYLFVDEMHAKSFITDLEMALAGGQIIAKSVAMVAVAFTVPGLGATSPLQVRDLPSMADVPAYESGDTVVLRRFTRTAGTLTIVECIGKVSGYVDQTDGTQTWLFIRNTGAAGGSMSGGTVAPDSLALDYGVSGNGYYEVNAVDGAYGVNSPYAQVVTWTTAPTGANKVVRTRFGKLTGITGVANEFGMIAGTYAASSGSYFRASNTMFELHNITAQWWAGFTPVVVISPGSGSPYLSIGNPAYAAAGMGPGIVLSYNQSTSRASLWCYAAGDSYLVFDGSLLYWRATNTTLDTAGNLTATSASLSGAITATSGYVAGDFVIGTGGQMRSGAVAYTAGVGWWLDYNAGVPRFRIGNPNGDRVAWDGATLTVRSGKLLIDGTANGHIGMGAAPYSIATLNIASDTDDASSYGLLVTNHSGTVPTLLTYGDGRLFLGGQLYIMPGAWDSTGQGTNPPSVWNGPFGAHEVSGWMRVYMYVGGGGGIPPTGPYSRGWIPVWLG